MTRDDQARHLECLEAELAETCAKIREIRHDCDLTKAWLDGYDARDADMATAALDRLRSYAPISLASKATWPVGLALSEDGAPEQDGAPQPDSEEYWDYL